MEFLNTVWYGPTTMLNNLPKTSKFKLAIKNLHQFESNAIEIIHFFGPKYGCLLNFQVSGYGQRGQGG